MYFFHPTFKTYFLLRISSLKKTLHCVVDSLEKEVKLVENANEVMIVRYASLWKKNKKQNFCFSISVGGKKKWNASSENCVLLQTFSHIIKLLSLLLVCPLYPKKVHIRKTKTWIVRWVGHFWLGTRAYISWTNVPRLVPVPFNFNLWGLYFSYFQVPAGPTSDVCCVCTVHTKLSLISPASRFICYGQFNFNKDTECRSTFCFSTNYSRTIPQQC